MTRSSSDVHPVVRDSHRPRLAEDRAPQVVGLFAGIGGIEAGLARAGFFMRGLCELDDAATLVLQERFPALNGGLWRDVRDLDKLPETDLLSAGFPCQDLSQAGRKAGISGSQSSLVEHVFRLVDQARIPTVLLENVSYMLRLDRGSAMKYLVEEFERRGYSWAYRVVDARAFGIPQRRQRVVVVATLDGDPSAVLHADDAQSVDYDDSVDSVDANAAYGFYWTEGLRGLGWTKNAVPTIKGGSRLGIPSPPAVWVPLTDEVGTPTIEDLETLQGFPRGWTKAAEGGAAPRKGARWHLVGNAVCVPMSEWVGRRLREPGVVNAAKRALRNGVWPVAAMGFPSGERYAVQVTMRPFDNEFSILNVLCDPLKPLSLRATRGFLRRADQSALRFADGFLDSLRRHLERAQGCEV